jgi:hypothetical protein
MLFAYLDTFRVIAAYYVVMLHAVHACSCGKARRAWHNLKELLCICLCMGMYGPEWFMCCVQLIMMFYAMADCPGGYASYMDGFPVLLHVCNGHGECDSEGLCVCDMLYSGDACQNGKDP